ncbi:MAG: shikimate kinase [Candidatus Thorarchaeota archaeon]|jgi:shikimate kinase
MKGATKGCIGIIGFMGTGKTSIGKALARSIRRQFEDTDGLVEKRSGKSIPQIFSEDGEDVFRDLESEVVREVCRLESAVISFGGGVVLQHSNVEMIKKNCIVVLLQASPETMVTRTSSENTRPLLFENENNLRDRISVLLAEREALYHDAMDVAIDTDSKSVDEIVSEIIGRLQL